MTKARTLADFDSSSINASVLTGTLPALNGSALTGISSGGITQALRATNSTTITVNSTDYSQTVLTQAIDPAASTSKIILMGNIQFSLQATNDDRGFGYRILRDSTTLYTSPTLYNKYHKSTNSHFIEGGNFPFYFIDDGLADGNSVTYTIKVANWGGTGKTITLNADGNQSELMVLELET